MIQSKQNLTRPRRLLSVDGGGIRGIIPAQILLKIENLLCNPPNSPWKCLGDYFDFIGGTSTGSIIAAGLAKGMKVQEILDVYTKHGKEIFTKRWLTGRLWSKYDPKNLEKKLQEILGPLTLGDKDLRSYLMIVSQNVTTNRTWFFVSHPNNEFFEQNSNIPLWEIARASSAAPTFFPPHTLNISNEQNEFIDGAMSEFNNPSLQLFLEATQQDYGIKWKTGADKLLMISIGTGFSNQLIPFGKAKGYTLIDWAGYAVNDLMEEANIEQNLLMKLIGKPQKLNALESQEVSLPIIDSIHKLKTGGLFSTNGESNPQLLTYYRHTTSLSKERFKKLNLHIDPSSVSSIDCVDHISELCEIGQAIAEEQVRIENFDGFLASDY
jgi:hypothetical protein